MPRILSPIDIRRFRERLCDIAAQLLTETGPDGFNMRELAARAGVSAMTTYRYFKDKDEILAAIRARGFQCLAGKLEEAASRSADVDEKLSAAAQAYVAFSYEDRFRYKMMFDFSQTSSKDAEMEAGESRLSRVFSELGDLLVKKGRVAGDPSTIGQALWATLHGAMALSLIAKIRDSDLSRLLTDALGVFCGTRIFVVDVCVEHASDCVESDNSASSSQPYAVRSAAH